MVTGCATPPKIEETDAYEDFSHRSRQELIDDFKEQFEGRCLHKNIIPTICECKILGVTSKGILLHGTGGNFTHKFYLKPEFSTGLAWYIIKSGKNIGGIQVSDKTMALEIYHLLEAIYQKTPKEQKSTYIPRLNAKVVSLRFFEAGSSAPPKKERKYRTKFIKGDIRLIYWELNLTYPQRTQRINFPIHVIYHDPLGRILCVQDRKGWIEPGWRASYNIGGYGKKFQWTWDRGEYRVDVYIGDDEVASETFIIDKK